MEKKTNHFKILILGDHAVGKSCFIIRYTDDTFQDVYLSTIGMDCKYKDVILEEDKSIRLQIWDTAGQDRFRSITKNLYKGAAGIMLIYDITNRNTFDNVKKWVNSIKEEVTSKVVIVLVGNKIDLDKKRQVQTDEGEQIAEEFDMPFFECSALTGENSNSAGETGAKKLVEVKAKAKQHGEQLKQNKVGGEKKSCC